MRIMCVFYRWGKGLVGGAEIHFYRLAQTLASLGHEVDIYTTRSLGLSHSRFGSVVWDNQFSPLPESEDGLRIYRFRVKNPSPSEARKLVAKVSKRFEKEWNAKIFAEGAGIAAEEGNGYLLAGWNELEEWGNPRYPVRWTKRSATLVLKGTNVHDVAVLVYAAAPTKGRLEIADQASQRFELSGAETQWINLACQTSGPAICTIRVDKRLATGNDTRELGIAVREIRFTDENGAHSIELARDFQAFLMTESENNISEAFWNSALRRPRRFARYQKRIAGPVSRQLARAVTRAAPAYDIVLANMIPMHTMEIASKAAAKAKKPLVLFPLFHPRDPNHYWRHFHDQMKKADCVDGNSPAIERLLAERGFRAECIGPGFDIAEFSNPNISGARFRQKHGLQTEKILLFVGRKVQSKRYDLAADAVRELRSRGWPARLVMIGPDEDKMFLLGDHILYLGRLSREELLDAYDACDVFIMPSIAESFGMVFCEAWMLRKPVLGNRNCAAVASLIDEGKDGFLATTSSEFADRAEEILRDPESGSAMGENGYRKVLKEFTWEAVGAKCEALLESLIS